MAAVASPPPAVSAMRDESVMDTRTPSPIQRTESQDSAAPDSYKPDLSAEVAMLSTKLVNAINYQTNLDDTLQHTRHELDQARKELQQLRAQKQESDEQIANGVLVKKSQVDKTMAQLREELARERTAREAAEKAKKETEGELENLTSALFEEANTMVAAARRDTEAEQKRSSQLRSQLNDTELLLASQQEQLQDLKTVMEKMEQLSDREGSGVRDSSMPSTPINATTATFDALQLSTHGMPEVSPDHPLHFSQLLAPVLRNDVSAYTDFQELMLSARRGAPHSRNSSNSGNVLTSTSQTNLSSAASSSPSLPGAFSFSSASNSPIQSSTFASQSTPQLRESKFYKRTLVEDIEPTLRLDLAPGLSFLSRRTVLSSLLGGTLVVEPFSPQTKYYGPIFACALCGEQRKNEPYVRKHRFRTSEEESAQRYPLCDYCLSRIRATGDFVGFLRMVRDGHWRAGSDEEQKGAWEESVRLREKMFWARLGGGVVPASQLRGGEHVVNDSPQSARAVKSVRASLESVPERKAKENAVAAASDMMKGGEGEQDVFRPEQMERDVTLRSVMGSSRGSVAVAKPDALAQENTEHAAPSEEPTNPELQSSTLQSSQETDEPTTPAFEDAQSDSRDAGPSEQLHREADEASARNVPEQPQEPPTQGEPTSTAETMPASAAEALSAPAPPPTERRPSAVLARVRAMEAKAQEGRSSSPEKKFPGAFD